MKISAVYIAKNEENNIARSLESVKNSVDELILVDTGSTDDTMDIFRRYGGQVYQQAWQDDFSAARNFAFSKGTGTIYSGWMQMMYCLRKVNSDF